MPWLLAIIFLTVGGLTGFGFAVWFFGIDAECEARRADAWDEGYMTSYADQHGYRHRTDADVPSWMRRIMLLKNPYRPDVAEADDE